MYIGWVQGLRELQGLGAGGSLQMNLGLKLGFRVRVLGVGFQPQLPVSSDKVL